MAVMNTIYRSLTDKNYYRLSSKGVVQIRLDDNMWVNTDKAPEYLDRVCTSNERVNGCEYYDDFDTHNMKSLNEEAAKIVKASTVTRRGWLLRLLGRLRHV